MTAYFTAFILAYIHCVPCVAHTILCLLVMWCTLCRLNYMSKQTKMNITMGYFSVGFAASLLLFVHTQLWVLATLVVLLGWFLFTSKNWKNCEHVQA